MLVLLLMILAERKEREASPEKFFPSSSSSLPFKMQS